MLTIENIEVVYHHTIQALRGLSLEAPEGKIVALLGSNGAGKTTTLKAATRLLELENGKIREGRISFKGKPVEDFTPDALVHEGLFHIREGRRIGGGREAVELTPDLEAESDLIEKHPALGEHALT